MSLEFVLPVKDQILEQLEDALLFVHKDGQIIWGNHASKRLLSIDNQPYEQSINDYIDFDLLMKEPEKSLLMEQKDHKNRVIDIKLIQVNQSIYCLILRKVIFGENTVAAKKNIDWLMQASSEGMVIFNGDRIIDCDLEFATLFGYLQSEIIGMSVNRLIDKKSTNKLAQVIEDYPKLSHELIGIRKSGEIFNIEFMAHSYQNQGNMMRIAIVKDISQRIKYEKRLEYMAYYDELTDLPNRNYFIKVLEDAIVEAKENNELLSVSFVDLDYFKEINETLGYDFGDKLLAACGTKFKEFKDTNTFIARMGGDKFLILQRYIVDKNIPIQFAKDLISEFEKPINLNDYDVFLSISIGISIYPENGETPDDLIKHADSAMYVIKEKHRNNYKLFESSISSKFKMMLTMESDLRKAIRKGEFVLHYQPQKCLLTNKLVGMEALIRWNHPENGYIPPLDFIPLAEKTGLIIDIGDWVLEEACRQNKAWQDKGYNPIVISVNLSAKQFHQQDLLEKIEAVLMRTGLAPEYLELEITESMAMTNEESILKTMHRLRELGVLVSIDDFGTGYSSLKYLSIFPITKLKIDKTFMDKGQKQNEAIVKSIINMSHSLNMKVIAEGVETISQLEFLEKEKCDEIQGYYFSKPLPPEQLISFL